MMMVLRSHGLGGLCQHGEEHQLCATVASIMLPKSRELYISQPQGFYCKSKFIKYTIFEEAALKTFRPIPMEEECKPPLSMS
jgi:hypothetical protein